MKQAVGTSLVIAALAAVASFACSETVDSAEHTDVDANEIVGGTEATPGSWPGAVALFSGNTQVCGGTLVADEWVITAGHCIRPGSATGGISKVVIGRHKLSTTDGESITVKKATRNAGFSDATLDNDIAILQLTSKSTHPVAKIMAPETFATLAPTGTVTVVGWGTMSEGAFSSSPVLRQVDVPVIPNATCKAFSRYDTVTDNMICAGFTEGGKDSCQGDSGGPLFAKVGGTTYHMGVVSWGIGCARANAPGVYTKLVNYLPWLAEQSGGAVKATPGNPVDTDGGAPPPNVDGGAADGGAEPPPAGFTPINETGSVTKAQNKTFAYDVPAGTYKLQLTGTNDADLYVKRNAVATTAASGGYDCRSARDGSTESCSVTFAEAGKLNVTVRGWATGSSNYTLKGTKE